MVPVNLPDSAGIQQVVQETSFLEIILDSRLDAVVALLTWETMMTLNWDEFANRMDFSYAYIIQYSMYGLRHCLDLPYIDDPCPVRSDVEEEVADYYENHNSDLDTAKSTSIPTGSVSSPLTPA